MSVDGTFETRLYINGNFCPGNTGKQFSVRSPTTGEIIAHVDEAEEIDVDNAVAAAKSASAAWKDLSPRERGAYLRRLGDLIEASQDELERIEAIATGKCVSQFFEASVAADVFRYFAEAGWHAQGTTSLHTPDHINFSLKQPFGVVACITPWNLPILMFAYKVAPALAAGNTVVHKSSEKAPLSALFLATLADKARFPPGVLNMISGFGTPAGSALASHMEVRCLSFTGSSATGQKIQIAALNSNMKHLHLELGGKSPALIFHDADLQAAAEQTAASLTFMTGQSCITNSRIYVEESVADKFIGLFKKAFTSSHLGNPLDPDTTHGPQIDTVQCDRVQSYIKIGCNDGTLLTGGRAGPGCFVEPTMFENVPEDSPLMQEEVFGPVVVINRFGSESEAIDCANRSEFGLYSSVFTGNMDRAMRVARNLEAGTVAINCTSPTLAMDMPFGGWKRSGLGREGYMDSLENFLENKTVLMHISPQPE
ncbi:aldehyde dehydrogenase [Aspergillus steynii IBT 23096]|uniref:aldehyde dehydrogenase (NAD(+)) n=1 Tax=Aspergillus steynii IBT 23096 TaxID=1392250 RepID=A0A2I2G120_9EURO|nr:aldehyde dehydrogenase [Aspergillus steynii IBT 23096]PLB46580.1 aldehyde dehydrogenase [Aspergillus steynii IBT 23096]